MPRSVSNAFIQESFASSTGDEYVVLAILSHTNLDGDLYLANSAEDISSEGITYTACPFEVNLPSDDDSAPSVTVQIKNVSPRIGQAVEGLQNPIGVELKIVLRSQPDTVEAHFIGLELVSVTIDNLWVSGTLVGAARLEQESYPNMRATPATTPALFK